ncbi:DUF2388 domain-containing protein [Pseudomonas sp. K1(2024)]|uniref:DUF2388 domain-containing protein n=2 Tax=Pseudomonas TaxID=286 RepID=A0AAI8K761_9PSED|nr:MULTISPECIES: DUF2388 domain-containing protein [Pseudomonas]AIZ35059.1 Holliday junction resolvase [Pseudomonas parafulva]AXO86515.1 DUF2388 domain-containing protein [Pseudomonas parafulva]MDO7901146.1 DUF2388 domain-containing protein [Pseudomonas sp. K13]MDV9033128.1 DUF2388 domain-containing protein [Pseudomonas sp. RAC1]
MRYLITLLLAFASVGSVHAMDVTTQFPIMTGYVTTQVTTAPFDRKIVGMARDDAATFVASGGQIRSARLQAALVELRRHHWLGNHDDLELAEAILVQ